MLQHGIFSTCGDTSEPTLTNTNPWYGLYDTTYSLPSGQQLFIIPRAPTYIDYNAYTVAQVVDEYNTIFVPGGTATWNDILTSEVVTTVGFLTSFDMRGYMLHQGKDEKGKCDERFSNSLRFLLLLQETSFKPLIPLAKLVR